MVGLKKITAAMAAVILSAAAFGNEGALLSESDLGWTANSSYPHAERIRARAMAQRFGVAAEQTALGFKDNIAADISDGGIIGDWHPVDNGFRLSFGAVHPGDSPRGGNSAGDENFKPYIGLGWGGQTRRGIGFNIDVGALYRRGRTELFPAAAAISPTTATMHRPLIVRRRFRRRASPTWRKSLTNPNGIRCLRWNLNIAFSREIRRARQQGNSH